MLLFSIFSNFGCSIDERLSQRFFGFTFKLSLSFFLHKFSLFVIVVVVGADVADDDDDDDDDESILVINCGISQTLNCEQTDDGDIDAKFLFNKFKVCLGSIDKSTKL